MVPCQAEKPYEIERRVMKIRFRRKSQPEWVVLFVLTMPFAFFLFIDVLGLPYSVKYMVDAAWLLLLLYMVKGRVRLPNAQAKRLAAIMALFFGIGMFVYVFRFQSPLYYLWGLRNNARFFVFFFACVVFVKERSAEQYLKLFNKVFWINIPVLVYQYVVMGKGQDTLGGVFGVEKGCNGYLNVFLVIVVTLSILRYLNGKEKPSYCFLKCAAALVITVFAELKVFVVELALVAALSAMMTRFSLRKAAVLLGTAVGVILTGRLIAARFPAFSDWFRISGMLEILSAYGGYTGSSDLNRLTAIPVSLSYLPTLGEKLFGLGLGNCDYASFDFLVTPFFTAHENLHYVWFSSSFLVLETGLVGLVLYCLFFVWVYLGATARENRGQADPLLCQSARILAIMCLVLVIYNASLRTEAAYMMYFVLALPFLSKEKRRVPQTNSTGAVLVR